ncbi:MAG: hypothetical protein WC295_12605, partial [Methanoregula sp.]
GYPSHRSAVRNGSSEIENSLSKILCAMRGGNLPYSLRARSDNEIEYLIEAHAGSELRQECNIFPVGTLLVIRQCLLNPAHPDMHPDFCIFF